MSNPRTNIAALHAYTPGEQPQGAEARRVVKLNTNESPYPPSPRAVEVLREMSADALRRYPSPASRELCEAAAELHDLQADQVVATNGGDELLRLALTAYAAPSSDAAPSGRGGIGVTDPTYSLYPVLAATHGCSVTVVPRTEAFDLHEATAQRWNDAGCAVGFVVNPHAPSGKLLGFGRLAELARAFHGVLVVDEAYVDFAAHDALGLIRGADALPNVLILRSMSKGYGLAGLRLGYGLGSAQLIGVLHKARDSYNVDAVAQAVGGAALRDQAYARTVWQKVKDERARLAETLREMRFDIGDSHANFVLARVPADLGTTADKLYEALKAKGVLVRYFDAAGLSDRLRITVGTAEQNNRLIEEIAEAIAAPVAAGGDA
ncbi:MAG: histidinol-phosphate transaminase [Planctomycetota bacterium]